MNGELTLGIRKRLHQELKYVVKVQPSRVNIGNRFKTFMIIIYKKSVYKLQTLRHRINIQIK